MRRRYMGRYHSVGRRGIMGRKHILGDAVKKHPLNMFFLLSFVLGVVCMNLWKENQASLMLMLQQFLRWSGNGLEMAPGDLFAFLLKERGLLFLVLVFFGSGKYGKLFHGLFVTYLGFGVGLICTSFLLVFGAVGILLVAGSFFPQFLFYFLIYFLLVKGLRIWKRQREGKTGAVSAKERGIIVCFYVLLVLILLLGVLSEAYVNPVILEKISGIVLN